MKFPDDFTIKPHILPGTTHWLITKPNGIEISVVGGGIGPHGDGVTTFEMWDFDDEEPKGYLTIEDINRHLSLIPW